ncbi:hypothetical protein ZWY2020_048060 [Hordeum vulgare]|nr:hypothetical protein ZWY2020_048060 [Hordeum vulgare]
MALMTKGFNDDQKKTTDNMGMQSLMNVLCSNLVNPLCDWLGEIYDLKYVFCTLGVPCVELIVPYEANSDIEQELFHRLFLMMQPCLMSDMKLLMYLIPCLFAPSTSLRASTKCIPILVNAPHLFLIDDVKNMNWRKFVADFLHDALSNKMYRNRLPPTPNGGLPPSHKFAISVWTNDLVNVVLAADRITDTTYGKLQVSDILLLPFMPPDCFGGPSNFAKWMDAHSAPSCTPDYFTNAFASAPVEHLVGHFASGMTSLLGKLVEGRQASTVVAGSPSKRGGTVEDLAQCPYGKKRRTHAGASRRSFAKHAPTPSCASAQLNKGVTTAVGISSTRSSPCASLSNTGDPVVKKTVSRPTKTINKDALERIHSKLATSRNVEIHVLLVIKPVNTTSGAIAISHAQLSGSDESVYARTSEVVPLLLSMGDTSTIPSGRFASDEVSAPELIFNKEDSRSSGTDSTRGASSTALPTQEGVAAEIPDHRTSTVPRAAPFGDADPIAEDAPIPDQRTSIVPDSSPLSRLLPKIMFQMYQNLVPENIVDKCDHHYTICLDLKHQRFEVLDSIRSRDDTSLSSHAEFFVSNLKETRNRHYGSSKVKINHFPIKHVVTDKQSNGYDCRYYMLEYLAKWEGRKI